MDVAGFNTFDIAVIGIVVLGGLFGLVTGFVRGGLFVGSWIGAGVVTIFGYERVRPFAERYIDPDWLGAWIGGVVLFILALVVLHLVSHMLSGWVRSSRLNALDRSLGLIAGIATAAVIVSVAYLFLSDMWANEPPPEWVETARTRSTVESGALWVRSVMPSGIIGRTGKWLEDAQARARDADAAREALERLSSPPETAAPSAPEGYNESERRELDKLIQEAN